MKFSRIIRILNRVGISSYRNNFLKTTEYQLNLSTFEINKGTDEEMIFPDVETVMVFRGGFIVLHSTINENTESVNIDLRNINTLWIKKQKQPDKNKKEKIQEGGKK